MKTEESIVGAEPDGAIFTFVNDANSGITQCTVPAEIRKLSFTKTGNAAAFGADPERAIVAGVERQNGVVPNLIVNDFRLKNRETHSIEPRQPILGAEPDITIRRLSKGLDGISRQSIVSVPGAGGVLSNWNGPNNERGNVKKKNPQRNKNSTAIKKAARATNHVHGGVAILR